MTMSHKTLGDGENVVVFARTHVKALLPALLIGLALLGVGAVVDRQWLDGNPRLVWWLVVGAGLLALTVWPVLEWRSSTYTITDRRLVTRHGVLNKAGHDIPLARISDVAFESSLVDRMFGCGTLIISDASTHGTVRFRDIPRVEEAQRTINDLLQRAHRSRGDEGV